MHDLNLLSSWLRRVLSIAVLPFSVVRTRASSTRTFFCFVSDHSVSVTIAGLPPATATRILRGSVDFIPLLGIAKASEQQFAHVHSTYHRRSRLHGICARLNEKR